MEEVKSMWQTYHLELWFEDKLMAGVPKNSDIITSWLNARKPSEAAFARMETYTPIPELALQVAEEVQATAEAETKVWCGFKTDPSLGLYVDGYHLKAHFKDNANILQGFTHIKALKSKIADRLFVQEYRLYLHKEEPDGFWEHPVHVMTMQGPRSALKRNDYVEQPVIQATLKVLQDSVVKEELLRTILDLGSMKGFGAERGLSNGRYQYTLTAME